MQTAFAHPMQAEVDQGDWPLPESSPDPDIQKLWQAYTGQTAHALSEVVSAYIHPTRHTHSIASVDIDELLRDTSIGFGRVVGLNTVRGQYSRETPFDEYTCKDKTETQNRRSFVDFAIRAAIYTGAAKPDEDIESLAETLRKWRTNGVYVVANTAGLEGCDTATIGFLQEFLPGCFDAVLFPRNHDGNGEVTKVEALKLLAETTGMELSDMPLAFLDDMEHQLTDAINTLGTGRLRLHALAKHQFNQVPEGATSADKSSDIIGEADKFFERSRLWLPWNFLSHAIEPDNPKVHGQIYDAAALYNRAAFAYLTNHLQQVWETIADLPSLEGEWHPTGHGIFKLDQLEAFDVDPLLGQPRLHVWPSELRGRDIHEEAETALIQGIPDRAWHDHYWYIASQSTLPHKQLVREGQLQHAYSDILYNKRLEGLDLPQEELVERGLLRECTVAYGPADTHALTPTGRCFSLQESERRVITDKHTIEPFVPHATTIPRSSLVATFVLAGNRIRSGGPMVFMQGIEPDGRELVTRRQITAEEKAIIREQLLAAA